MSEMLYCYSCRTKHPMEKMTRHLTRQGYRWRCMNSLQARSKSAQERDLFGQQQTALNREAMLRSAEFRKRQPSGAQRDL